MRVDGFVNYISDNQNKIDLLMLFVFIAYFVLRLSYYEHESNVIIPSVADITSLDQMTKPWFTLIVLNVVIIIQMVLKICFFCKVNEKFGMLVQLIKTCIVDVTPFTTFMMIWLIAFTLIFILLGANNDVG